MEKSVRCDKRVSAQMKGKVYKMVVRTVMLYGLETKILRKRQLEEDVKDVEVLFWSNVNG